MTNEELENEVIRLQVQSAVHRMLLDWSLNLALSGGTTEDSVDQVEADVLQMIDDTIQPGAGREWVKDHAIWELKNVTKSLRSRNA